MFYTTLFLFFVQIKVVVLHQILFLIQEHSVITYIYLINIHYSINVYR